MYLWVIVLQSVKERSYQMVRLCHVTQMFQVTFSINGDNILIKGNPAVIREKQFNNG